MRKRIFAIIFTTCILLIMMTASAWADTQIQIESDDVSLSYSSKTYTGEAIEPYVYVYARRPNSSYTSSLKQGTDYIVKYSNNINVGTATVTITGNGYYTGTVTKTFEIEPRSISTATFTVDDVYYSEKPVIPTVTGKYNGKALVNNVDYTVALGTGDRVTIKGIGNFTGETSKYYSVKSKPLSMCSVSVLDQQYTGYALKPSVSVYNDGLLVPSNEYKVTYSNNVEVGTGTVTVSAVGYRNYTGSTTATFKIKYPIEKCSITTDAPTYNGSPVTPNVTIKKGNTVLKQGTDYSLSFFNNVNAGAGTVKITGMGYYTGTATKTFTIKPKSVSTAAVTLVLPEEKYIYSGKAFIPDATVADGTTPLVKDKDYTISYSKNINPGYGQVIITGIGNYGSTKTEKFNIYPSKAKISSFEVIDNNGIKIKWAKGPATCKYRVYRSGKLIGTTKKGATYFNDKKSKTNGKKYEYMIQAVSTASDSLKGEKSEAKHTYYFRAPVAKAGIAGNRALSVSWTKNSEVDGYQVQWSTSPSFKTKKTATIKDNATVSKFLSGLTAGKTYYFRVRAYKTITEEISVEVKKKAEDSQVVEKLTEDSMKEITVDKTTDIADAVDTTEEKREEKTEELTEVKTEKKTKKYYSSWSKTVSAKPITATVHASAS